jgi:nicotinamidase-related amidase
MKESNMSKQVHLICIDPQHDFCYKGDPNWWKNLPKNVQDAILNLPPETQDWIKFLAQPGKLSVPGADLAMKRVGDMIGKNTKKIDDIHVTLDSHQECHIANNTFWQDSKGDPPNAFTIVTSDMVRKGELKPVAMGQKVNWEGKEIRLEEYCQIYVDALAASGRYPLMLWPPHCLIGSFGESMMPAIDNGIKKWIADSGCALVNFVAKGSNFKTEHYGALKAEVPDSEDPSTQINTGLISVLEKADRIIAAGIAGSHCLANTLLDVANAFKDDSFVKKLILLTDGIAPVPGCEQMQEDFIKEMTSRGMQLSTTDSIFT